MCRRGIYSGKSKNGIFRRSIPKYLLCSVHEGSCRIYKTHCVHTSQKEAASLIQYYIENSTDHCSSHTLPSTLEMWCEFLPPLLIHAINSRLIAQKNLLIYIFKQAIYIHISQRIEVLALIPAEHHRSQTSSQRNTSPPLPSGFYCQANSESILPSHPRSYVS